MSSMKLRPWGSMAAMRALPDSMNALSASLCQCSSRYAPAFSRMFTPAKVVATGNSRTVTSRAQPPVWRRLCAAAKGNFRFGRLPESVGGAPGFCNATATLSGPSTDAPSSPRTVATASGESVVFIGSSLQPVGYARLVRCISDRASGGVAFLPASLVGPSAQLVVVGFVDVAADERLHVGGAVNAGEAAVEHQLGDARGGVDLGFEDVGLQRVEAALFEQGVWHLVGDGTCGLDKHVVGDSFGLRRVDGHPDRREDVEVVGLAGQERLAVQMNGRELDSGGVDRLSLRP